MHIGLFWGEVAPPREHNRAVTVDGERGAERFHGNQVRAARHPGRRRYSVGSGLPSCLKRPRLQVAPG
jgi:hypothetical protein